MKPTSTVSITKLPVCHRTQKNQVRKVRERERVRTRKLERGKIERRTGLGRFARYSRPFQKKRISSKTVFLIFSVQFNYVKPKWIHSPINRILLSRAFRRLFQSILMTIIVFQKEAVNLADLLTYSHRGPTIETPCNNITLAPHKRKLASTLRVESPCTSSTIYTPIISLLVPLNKIYLRKLLSSDTL